MCLLTFLPAGVMPDTAALESGAFYCGDGHGFAIVAGDRLIVRRNMDFGRLLSDFVLTRHTHRQGPAIFHSRLGTHGTLNVDNCHPFQLGKDGKTVVAHNGILPAAMWPKKGDVRCDTRIACEDFLPGRPFGSLATRRGRSRLGKWLTARNKMAILTVNPRYRRNAYLINEDAGEWNEGVWYSNDLYRRPADDPWLSSDDELDYDQCGVCRSWGTVNPFGLFCEQCRACIDCLAHVDACLCYRPDQPVSLAGQWQADPPHHRTRWLAETFPADA